MSEIHQLSCPFCGFNKPIKEDFKLRELHIDPSEYGLISIRSVGLGPGRGHKGEKGEGLRTIGRLNIIEALQDSEHAELAEQVRMRFVSIMRSYLASGVVDFEELT